MTSYNTHNQTAISAECILSQGYVFPTLHPIESSIRRTPPVNLNRITE